MKNRLKKAAGAMLTLITFAAVLTGCMGDSVADDLEKFLNTDMKEVNAKYEEIKAESAKWDDMETDAETLKSINDVILPKLNESIEMLAKIEPETDEVKAVKQKYEEVMNTYKQGYEKLAAGLEDGNESTLEEGGKIIEEALGLLDEYNAALEKLASEHDMKIEY